MWWTKTSTLATPVWYAIMCVFAYIQGGRKIVWKCAFKELLDHHLSLIYKGAGLHWAIIDSLPALSVTCIAWTIDRKVLQNLAICLDTWFFNVWRKTCYQCRGCDAFYPWYLSDHGYNQQNDFMTWKMFHLYTRGKIGQENNMQFLKYKNLDKPSKNYPKKRY